MPSFVSTFKSCHSPIKPKLLSMMTVDDKIEDVAPQDDFEGAEEFDIDAPAAEGGSKKTLLLASVALLLAAGGGGYYYYTNQSQGSSLAPVNVAMDAAMPDAGILPGVDTGTVPMSMEDPSVDIFGSAELDIPQPEVMTNDADLSLDLGMPEQEVSADPVEDIFAQTDDMSAEGMMSFEKDILAISPDPAQEEPTLSEILSADPSDELFAMEPQEQGDPVAVDDFFAQEAAPQKEVEEAISSVVVAPQPMPNQASSPPVQEASPEVRMQPPEFPTQIVASEAAPKTREQQIVGDILQEVLSGKSGLNAVGAEFEEDQNAPTAVANEGAFESQSFASEVQMEPVEAPLPQLSERPERRFVVVKKSHQADSKKARVVSAQRALNLGRYDAALAMFEDVLRNNSSDRRALMGRAVALQKMGRIEEALTAYETMLDFEPNNKNALTNYLGILQKEFPSVAMNRLNRLYNEYPENAGIAAQLGVTYASLKNYDQAQRYLGIATSLEPKNAMHLYNAAIVVDKMGRGDDAARLYKEALEVDSVYGGRKSIPRDSIYDRLSILRQ